MEREIKIGRTQKIDLQEFQNRTADITFSAKGGNGNPWDGKLYWVDPVVEQNSEEQKKDFERNRFDDFRTRHKNDNLLVVLFDAATASHFGCYGYGRPTTPIVDAFAAEGIVYDNAVTQAVYTIASVGRAIGVSFSDRIPVILPL